MTNQTQQTMFSSNRDDWETPQDFFDKLNERYHFTLDPCCSDVNAKCPKHYTEQDNGLEQDWGGRNNILQPAILSQRRSRLMGKEMLRRKFKA